MERLTGLESLYLRLETDSMPMNMSSLMIYDRSAAPGGSEIGRASCRERV